MTLPRRRVRRAGAAMTETLVMLPLLTLLLGAGMRLHRHHVDAGLVRAEARRCAWAHAIAGCPDALPPDCESDGDAQAPPGVGDAETKRSTLADSLADDVHDGGGGFFEKLTEWPLVGPAFEVLLGRSHRASATRETAAPIGAGTASSAKDDVKEGEVAPEEEDEPDAGPPPRWMITRTHYALCNPDEAPTDSLALELFRKLNPFD